jgi:hypothetical protein
VKRQPTRGSLLPSLRFDDLPLFASNEQLGTAIVGAERAKYWADVTVKSLELMPGFPQFDPAHGGRYSLGVKRFYEHHHGGDPASRPRVQDGQENPNAWTNSRPSQRSRRLG